ncbi:MAG: competence/damage-inducible protein A [Candidatus Omnitrophota bacterium]
MNAEIIAVGTEFLLGQGVNTNAVYLSRALASLGINVYFHTTVGDNRARLMSALKTALSRSDLIITTGGLGPTVDDITMGCIAAFSAKGMKSATSALSDIGKYFRKKGMARMPAVARKQALVPRNAAVFRNSVGTAPGVVLRHGRALIMALPGPPREMAPMFEDYGAAYLRENCCAGACVIKSRTLRTAGLIESRVNNRVRDVLSISGDTTVGIYAHPGNVDLRITAKAVDSRRADSRICRIERKIRQRLGDHIYGIDQDELEDAVGALLKSKHKTISTAESCTGGLVSDRITNVSGSSGYFLMGVTAYSNNAKTKILRVPAGVLDRYGAVSRRVAACMAKGAQRLSGSDIALGVTGIAGPAGGSRKKPVGLVYVSVVNGAKTRTWEFRLSGSRKDIKYQVSCLALDMVRRELMVTR